VDYLLLYLVVETLRFFAHLTTLCVCLRVYVCVYL
jgi:hypothetical protein